MLVEEIGLLVYPCSGNVYDMIRVSLLQVTDM